MENNLLKMTNDIQSFGSSDNSDIQSRGSLIYCIDN